VANTQTAGVDVVFLRRLIACTCIYIVHNLHRKKVARTVIQIESQEHGSSGLSYGDAETLFWEFVQRQHVILSNATYARLAFTNVMTNVMTDFVKLASQLMEHWLSYALVNARHCETGETVPSELLEKLEDSLSRLPNG